MAISKIWFIYLTFILSCVSCGLIITSFASQYWVQANLIGGSDKSYTIELNYGLFNGMMLRKIAEVNPISYSLYNQCLMDLNLCAWSCLSNSEDRDEEIRKLYHDGTYGFSCAETSPSKAADLIKKLDEEVNVDKSNLFLNAGIWISTLFFLTISLLMSFVSAIMSFINTVSSPIEPILNIFGLFIWNSIAVCSLLISLIIWGSNYSINLTTSLAYVEAIKGDFAVSSSSLDFSYWFLFISAVSHIVNIGALALRRHLLNNLPEVKTIQIEENNDGGIFLY